VFKHGHKQCLQAGHKQDIKHGHKHVHVRTDGTYEELTHLCGYLTFVNAREMSANA
jgi:hypothetical protein